jgi:hypothetical protein
MRPRQYRHHARVSITAMVQRRTVRKSREAPRATNILTLRRPFLALLVKSRGCVGRACLNKGLLDFPMKRSVSTSHVTRLSLVGYRIETLTHINTAKRRL